MEPEGQPVCDPSASASPSLRELQQLDEALISVSKQPGASKQAIKDKKQFPGVKSFYGGSLIRKGRNGTEKTLISNPKASSWMLPEHRGKR